MTANEVDLRLSPARPPRLSWSGLSEKEAFDDQVPIEVAHENGKEACDRHPVFMETGHFMTNADWGCGGVHRPGSSWRRAPGRGTQPAVRFESATIIALERFQPEDFSGLRGEHEG
jgi:hypothetical protein